MGLLDIVFPGFCPICKRRSSKSGVCEECVQSLDKLKSRRCRSVFENGTEYKFYSLYSYHNEDVKRYIFALKRTGNAELFDFAAKEVCESILSCAGLFGFTVCNAPRKKSNVRRYGYDHAKQVAKRIPRFYSRGFCEYYALLKRRGFSKEQKFLDAAQRKDNALHKFKAKGGKALSHIVIFDDIITTGSTFISCAKELKSVYPNAEIIGVFIAESRLGDNSDSLY